MNLVHVDELFEIHGDVSEHVLQPAIISFGQRVQQGFPLCLRKSQQPSDFFNRCVTVVGEVPEEIGRAHV